MMTDKPVWATPVDGVTLACIACDKELSNWGGCFNQPNEGLAFSTSGHWPSHIFDDCGDGNRLELSICNDCLLAKASRQIAFVPREDRGISNARVMTPEEVADLLGDLSDFENYRQDDGEED